MAQQGPERLFRTFQGVGCWFRDLHAGVPVQAGRAMSRNEGEVRQTLIEQCYTGIPRCEVRNDKEK
jgi:hypothetical protein